MPKRQSHEIPAEILNQVLTRLGLAEGALDEYEYVNGSVDNHVWRRVVSVPRSSGGGMTSSWSTVELRDGVVNVLRSHIVYARGKDGGVRMAKLSFPVGDSETASMSLHHKDGDGNVTADIVVDFFGDSVDEVYLGGGREGGEEEIIAGIQSFGAIEALSDRDISISGLVERLLSLPDSFESVTAGIFPVPEP